MYIHLKAFILSIEFFATCPRLFSSILWIFRGHSPECLTTFSGMFNGVPQNVFGNIPGIFGAIRRNVQRHSPGCMRTIPGMFGDIPWNLRGHSSYSPLSRHFVPHSCITVFTHSRLPEVLL